MALLRYRLPASGAAAVSPAFQTYSHNQSTRRILPTSDSTALANQAYTPDAADHLVAGDAMHVQFVSDQLIAGIVFASGETVKLCVQGLEAHASNNLFTQIWVGVYSSDGSTLQATLRSKVADGTELGTSLNSRILSSTLSGGYTTAANDRLVVEVSLTGTPSGSGGVQGHNGTIRFGANGAGGDLAENDSQTGTTLNPWFEIQATMPSYQAQLNARDFDFTPNSLTRLNDWMAQLNARDFDFLGQALTRINDYILSLNARNFPFVGNPIVQATIQLISLLARNFQFSGQSLTRLNDWIAQFSSRTFPITGQALTRLNAILIVIVTSGSQFVGRAINITTTVAQLGKQVMIWIGIRIGF